MRFKKKVVKNKKRYYVMTFVLLLALTCGFAGNTISVSAAEKKVQETTDKKQDIDYTIYVNLSKGFVRVTKQNPKDQQVQVRVMRCSVGTSKHPTPEGTFKTSDYYDWRLMVDNTFAQYAVRFNKHIMFHSVPYIERSPDTLEWDQYNKLGHPASLGCVRLTVADAKWIYDHCKKGTVVHVYRDYSEKVKVPETKIISENSSIRGWDPTDPDIDNPWND